MAPPPRLAAVLILFASLAFAASGVANLGEPEVTAEEVAAPATESDDAGWEPFYTRYEDPASVDCGGRKECVADVANHTADAQQGVAK